jgi:hypothetical protein
MDDLFSVPLGYVGPDQGPDDGVSTLPAIPDEAFDHRGKWVAFRGAGLDMIRDTKPTSSPRSASTSNGRSSR